MVYIDLISPVYSVMLIIDLAVVLVSVLRWRRGHKATRARNRRETRRPPSKPLPERTNGRGD
jgi:hypothetical protein